MSLLKEGNDNHAMNINNKKKVGTISSKQEVWIRDWEGGGPPPGPTKLSVEISSVAPVDIK